MKIECAGAPAREAIEAIYAPFLCRRRRAAHFACRIEPASGERGYIYRRGRTRHLAQTLADLLFLLDKDLTIALQRQRRDLYFVHAGVVSVRRSAVAFVAPSGTGKSTTVWALLGEGFRYVSDELMPLDIETRRVQPYPRALCFKTLPLDAPSLPKRTIDVGRLRYIPIGARARARPHSSLSLRAIFFLERTETGGRPKLEPVAVAEAGARLYANALNALAHPHLGLDAALLIARRARCYRLQLGGRAATVAAVQSVLGEEREHDRLGALL